MLDILVGCGFTVGGVLLIVDAYGIGGLGCVFFVFGLLYLAKPSK